MRIQLLSANFRTDNCSGIHIRFQESFIITMHRYNGLNGMEWKSFIVLVLNIFLKRTVYFLPLNCG